MFCEWYYKLFKNILFLRVTFYFKQLEMQLYFAE